jgi:hypothetical protein
MSKGGMSCNPFGGNPSLATFDEDVMMALHRHEISIDQALALRIIKMSARDYLYFGLGKNGITPEKFIEAYRYLYRERKVDPGMPANIKAKCFETHYEDSGMAPAMKIDTFLKNLKEKRLAIINANRQQIDTYMDEYRDQEWKSLHRGERKGKYDLPRVGIVSLLVAPEDLKAFGSLYLYGRRVPGMAKPHLAERLSKRLRSPSKALIYKKLLF